MPTSTYDLIVKKLGAETTYDMNPLVREVGTEVRQILRNDPSRLMYVLINLGPYDLYVCYDERVSATRGIKVAARGGHLVSWWEEDGRLVCLPLYGVAPGGTTQIFVALEKITKAVG